MLTIATPGAAALVNEAGDAATLILPDKTRWRYNGLHVTDAAGRVVPAHLAPASGGGIGITGGDGRRGVPDDHRPVRAAQAITYPGSTDPNAFRDSFGVRSGVERGWGHPRRWCIRQERPRGVVIYLHEEPAVNIAPPPSSLT